MKEKFYRIEGLTGKMVSNCQNGLKEDILVVNDGLFTDDGEVQAVIRLNWFEALIMRLRLRLWNSSHEGCFRLVRDI